MLFILVFVFSLFVFALYGKIKTFYEAKVVENPRNKYIFGLTVAIMLLAARIIKFILGYIQFNPTIICFSLNSYSVSICLDTIFFLMVLTLFAFRYKVVLNFSLNLQFVQFFLFLGLKIENSLLQLPKSFQFLFILLVGLNVAFLSVVWLKDFYFCFCFLAFSRAYFDTQSLLLFELEQHNNLTEELDLITGENLFHSLNLACSLLLGSPIKKKIGGYLLKAEYGFIVKRHMRRLASKAVTTVFESPEAALAAVTLTGGIILGTNQAVNNTRQTDAQVAASNAQAEAAAKVGEAADASKAASISQKAYYDGLNESSDSNKKEGGTLSTPAEAPGKTDGEVPGKTTGEDLPSDSILEESKGVLLSVYESSLTEKFLSFLKNLCF